MATIHDGLNCTSRRALVTVLALTLTVAGELLAQPGEWCVPGFVNPVGAGGHVTWAGDSMWYFPGGNSGTLFIFDPSRCATYAQSFPYEVDTGAVLTWAGDSYIYQLPGQVDVSFRRIRKRDLDVVAVSGPGVMAGLGSAMCWTGGDSIFAFLGGASGTFTRYRIGWSWSTRASPPSVPWVGAALAWAGGDTVYAMRGNSTREFWAYSTSGRVWTVKPLLPVPPSAGAALSWNGKSGSQSRLLMMPGGGSSQLWSYDVTNGTWDTLPSASYGIGGASEGALATFDRRSDHQHLYAVPGSGNVRLLRYGPKTAASLPFDESFEGNQFPPAKLEG